MATVGCAALKEQIRLQEEKQNAEENAMEDKMANFNANPDNPDLMMCEKKTPTGSHRPQTVCKIIKNGKRDKDLNYEPEGVVPEEETEDN